MKGQVTKRLRRIFAFALCLCLACGATFSSHAAQNQCDCGVSPIVYVAALGSATLYLDAGTPAERVLFRPTDEATQQLVMPLLLPAARYPLDRNAEAFAGSIANAVKGMLGELAMDENGDSNPRVTTKTTLPADPAHGIDKDYYFGYDFRVDPMVTADRLHEFIEHVEQLTGHEKVSLRASSLGGIVTMAYLQKYGSGDIDACIFQCCPVLGVAVAGDLFNKKIKLDPDALVRYGVQVLPQVDNGELLKPLIQALDCAGVFDALLGVGDALVDDLKDEIYEQLLIPVFGRMPGLWALVPLFLVLGLALGWSWSLRRQVSLRTAELRQELEHRQQAEDARRQLEQRIRRAQRLESLGVLAGGVAGVLAYTAAVFALDISETRALPRLLRR